MKLIASRDNPTLKSLRVLMNDPRRQRHACRTVIEGAHLVEACLAHRHPMDLLVTSESGLAHAEIESLVTSAAGVEVLCLRDALFRDLSELANPVGIMARIVIPPPSEHLPAADCLLLDAVQDAGNVGTLLRTASAAGVPDVVLGSGCAGAWAPRVMRAAQGAHFSLRIHEQVDLAAFMQHYPGQSVAAVAHDGNSLYGLNLRGKTAWLLGNEGQGIAPELIALASERATIPLEPGSESLNVAAAAAICLFEMRRQRTMA